MNESDWQHLVLQYLKKKGYSEAERAFSKSVQIDDSSDMSLSHRLAAHKGLIDSLVTYFEVDNDPKVYVEMFDTLATWVDNSLDMYRGELGRVLYPIFLHCYLKLIAMDGTAQASMLLNRYKRRLLDTAGRLTRSRAQELQQLQSVNAKQQLQTNRFAKQASTSKHTIRMSVYSHDLLMHFLHSGPRMLPLNEIVNQHLTFELVEGPPVGSVEAERGEEQGGEWEAGLEEDVQGTNQQEVWLGLLEDNLEDRYEDMKEENEKAAAAALQQQQQQTAAAAAAEGGAAATAGTPAADGAPAEPPTKKAKKAAAAAQSAAAAAQASQKKERGERVESKPFIPLLPEELQRQCLEDIQHRQELSKTTLPSCCFFTFVNTKQTLNCVSMSRDASKVAGGFSDSSVRLYDVPRLAQRSMAAASASAAAGLDAAADADAETPSTSGIHYFWGHTGPVHAVDFMPDARLLLSGGADGTVRLWSMDLDAALCAFRGHLLPVWDVAACPLGYYWASASADRTARIWSTDSTKSLRLLAGHQTDIDLVRWHPNCMYLATASADRTVRLWDVESGECVRFLPGQQANPTSLAFSPDGQQLAAGCDDGSTVVWDLGMARRLATLSGHVGPVWSLAFSYGDGTLLASGGADETVRLWSCESPMTAHPAASASAKGSGSAPQTTPSFTCLETFRTKSSPVIALSFSARNLLLGAGAFNLRSLR